MEIWQAIILGITQGLGEFLPISSSGHLVLVRELFGIEGDYMFFDIMMHIGTLGAVAVVFFKDLLALFKPPFRTLLLLALASVPAGLVGIFANDYISAFFESGKYLCFFFLATAGLMFLTEYLSKRTKETKPLGVKTAIAMGLMQGVGVFPGISRSGSTIFGGTVAKGDRTEIAKFSFMMSIPPILGSLVLELFDLEVVAIDWGCVIVGTITSFISGFLAIKFMMRIISKANYKWFGLYLVVVAILTFIFLFLGV